MSTLNYCMDLAQMEAKERISRLEWELACEKEWTEKLQKIAREHYNNYKNAEQAIKERDEAREEAKQYKARYYDMLKKSR